MIAVHRVLVFDINETLLDLSPLDALFASHLGEARIRREWFASLLSNAFALSLCGSYRSFTDLGASAARIVAKNYGGDAERLWSAIRDALPALRAYPDVAPALERLSRAGFRIAALSQSPQSTLDAQLTGAGLAEFFTAICSVETIRTYKPHPAAYRMVARRFECDLSNILMIAAHDWDVAGAMAAGCSAAFVARPGRSIDDIILKPTFVVGDIEELAEMLLPSR